MSTQEGQSVTYDSARTGLPEVRLIHFNDVYHVQPRSAEPVGGAARFQTLLDQYKTCPAYEGLPNVQTIFSGDAFSPSIESSISKGRHMVPFLNRTGIDVACLGNHDIDFGIEQFQHLQSQCKFPWLLGNVLDKDLGEDTSMAGLEKTCMLESSTGVKIGVIGLIEREWLDTVNVLPPRVEFQDAVETAKRLVPLLREQGAELIIAVTHQREPNDNRLAQEIPEGLIDIILGGHDHYYQHTLINKTHVLRSGSDFFQLSYLEGWRKPGGDGWDFNITRRDVLRSTPENETVKQLVSKLTSKLSVKLEKPIGHTSTSLESRFVVIRQAESNLGNFICDVMRLYYGGDCCMIASGTMRSDQIFPPGTLRLMDLLNCLPFEDGTVVIKVTGSAIREALENGVGNLPALDGRFPQVSNIQFSYSVNRPSGQRIVDASIGGEPIDDGRIYTLVTRGYMARGKDGYSSLISKSEGGIAEDVVTEEEGIILSTILRQYFLSSKVIGTWDRMSTTSATKWNSISASLSTGTTRNDSPGSEPSSGESGGKHLKYVRSASSEHSPDTAAPITEPSDAEVDLSGMDSESEDETERLEATVPCTYVTSKAKDLQEAKRHEYLARRYVAIWRKKAGIAPLSVQPSVPAELTAPRWTKSIAPQFEGRIVRVD